MFFGDRGAQLGAGTVDVLARVKPVSIGFARGEAILPGQVVITGSYAGVLTLAPDSEATLRYGELGLIKRGLRGVKFIASDDHAGLKAARKAMFAGVPWQRCQFHLQHNAQAYVSKLDSRMPVARAIRCISPATRGPSPVTTTRASAPASPSPRPQKPNDSSHIGTKQLKPS